jgi:hypothetical protein
VTTLDRAAEYAAAAEAWRAFCARGPKRTDTADEPLAVALLAGLCEPAPLAEHFTGDLLADMLTGLTAFVRRLEADAEDGGGGGIFVHTPALAAWRRRLDALITLREYERSHRELLVRKLAGENGGGP